MILANRVVVTGLGIVAPNGIGRKSFWESLLAGRSGIGRITLFDAHRHGAQVAGEVKDFDLRVFHTPKTSLKRLARQSQFSIAAAKLALIDAGFPEATIPRNGPVPLMLGISSSAIEIIESGMERLYTLGPTRVPTHIVSACQPQQAASVVADELGFLTDAQTTSSACAAGLDAIGAIYGVIRAGKAEIAIAGGADAPITPLTFACLDKAGLASRRTDAPGRTSRPFDRDCDSGVISEGAGILILENLGHALARGAKIYAEITGYGSRADSDRQVPGSGLPSAIRTALANACRRPEDIDYICAHGPGHPLIDLAETKMIKEVFGDHAYSIPVSSIKGVTGNPLAAAGPFQLAACCLALREGMIPPTANLENPAPGCDLDYVQGEARPARLDAALINVHGLGGSNGSMVVERVEESCC